jgi:hypothetical protein
MVRHLVVHPQDQRHALFARLLRDCTRETRASRSGADQALGGDSVRLSDVLPRVEMLAMPLPGAEPGSS